MQPASNVFQVLKYARVVDYLTLTADKDTCTFTLPGAIQKKSRYPADSWSLYS